MSTIESLQSLANDIALGFDALLEKLDEQKKVEADLKEQLSHRINSNYSENPSDGSFSQWQDEIVKQISYSPTLKIPRKVDDLPEILNARNAIKTLKADMAQSTPRKCPVQHKSAQAEIHAISIPRTCPVPHKAPPKYDEMEQDFTTQGKPSSLECPFAKMRKNGTLDPTSQLDPIAAEFHADSLSAQSLDEARACGRCPMRFMDKHSPEEIAEYFEKHKHELPRSHEICVKRYQKNESSIRQLDEKYGNIVSMIQGLGNKHKQYMRSDDQENQSATDQKSNAAVVKWAKDVDGSANDEPEPVEEEDSRISHFDKPLPDIRVGESPTRPWGISVPVNRPTASSVISSQQELAQSLDKPTASPTPAKPVTEQARPATVRTQRTQSITSTTRSRGSRSSRRPQIIFNGPVFLGYSPEQAATFLQHLGTERRG